MNSPINTNRKLFPLILFLLSLGVVFYQYLQIPKNTTFDEIEFAKLALSLNGKTYTPYSFLATGHATLYFYIILLSFKVFGTTLFALRFPSAVFGVINPVLFYFILIKLHQTYNPKEELTGFIPFLLSFIFLTMRWYFNFARFGFEATFLLFLEFSSILSILVFLTEPKKRMWLILSGLFAGLAYNSYQPGRIFFIIPVLLLLHFLLIQKKKKQISYTHTLQTVLYFFIPFFILILPLTIYLNIHKDIRFYQQFYPDNHEMTLQEKGEFFMRNLSSTAGIFHIKGDVNGRHNYPNKPALNPILGVLFVGGLLVALRWIKRTPNLMFILWFLISLGPTLVTYPWENPNMLRTFTVIPSVVYFIGVAFYSLLHILNNKPAVLKVVVIIFVLLISVSSFYELRTYFVHQSKVFKEAFEAERNLILYINPHYEDNK